MLPPRQSYSRSMPQGMWKSFKSDDDKFLQPNTKHSIPLGPELVSHTELKIRISPTVRASEIKVARFTEKTWPRVYDDVKLKPVEYLITVNGNGEISVSSAEWYCNHHLDPVNPIRHCVLLRFRIQLLPGSWPPFIYHRNRPVEAWGPYLSDSLPFHHHISAWVSW